MPVIFAVGNFIIGLKLLVRELVFTIVDAFAADDGAMDWLFENWLRQLILLPLL